MSPRTSLPAAATPAAAVPFLPLTLTFAQTLGIDRDGEDCGEANRPGGWEWGQGTLGGRGLQEMGGASAFTPF